MSNAKSSHWQKVNAQDMLNSAHTKSQKQVAVTSYLRDAPLVACVPNLRFWITGRKHNTPGSETNDFIAHSRSTTFILTMGSKQTCLNFEADRIFISPNDKLTF
jgi:hypothetical protein